MTLIFENKKTMTAITLSILLSSIAVLAVEIQTAEAQPTFLFEFGSPGTGPGQFTSPEGIAADSLDRILVGDSANNRVQVFDSSGNFLSEFGSFCNLEFPVDCVDPDGPGPLQLGDGQFSDPIGIIVDSFDRIIVADTANRRVQAFDSSGNFLFKFGSECSLSTTFGCVDPDGPGPLELGDGQFLGPRDVTVDNSDRIIVADGGNERVQAFDSSGNFLFKFGSTGTGPGQFTGIGNLATDSSDRIIVADGSNHRVQVFDSSGNFLFEFGSFCQLEFPVDCVDPDGPGPLELGDGQFDNPSGVTVDSSDTIIVSEEDGNRVQAFDSSGNFLSKFGSFGAGPGQFDAAVGITVDNSDRIIVADTDNERIQVFSAFIPTQGTLKITETTIGGDDTLGFTISGPTPSTPSITTVSGSGMDGPNTVDPGIYSIQQSTIPIDWSLPTAICNDGSSTFSVDTVSGIVINPGDNIECEFINTFEGSTTPADEIQDIIDIITGLGLPNGVENSLLGPLHMAIALLEDGNPNNDTAVCGKLTAFLNEVNAKEANGDLTATQAQQLRDAVIAIQTSLGC